LPELLPTETYEARLYLAKTERDRVQLLREAVDGFLLFARTTLPYVREMDRGGVQALPGLGRNEAEQKVELGLDAAKQLEAVCRASGDKSGGAWAANAVAELEAALGVSK